jgi:two-component system, chemotaxis family, protein-glutamate methylesterase/glutaminase
VTPVSQRAVRLLIVDRSPAARELLRRVFEPVADIDVIDDAGTAEKALRLVGESTPNLILVDCDMPKPGSFALVRDMMRQYPVPVVMLTKVKDAAAEFESRALETGAVALVVWNMNDTGRDRDNDLVRVVRAMSEVKVVRRRDSLHRGAQHEPPEAPNRSQTTTGRVDVVAIGASTGGPPVLQTIFNGLQRPFPVPIVVVQHLSKGFQKSLVGWLADSTGMTITVGEHGMPLESGVVYFAPDDQHMMVDASGRLLLIDDPPENASRPSVSVLFRSVALRYGANAMGILLTGMGRDGAKELRQMRDRGAVTIAQDEETSVVHGMPGEAIKLKGARYVLPPDRIPAMIERNLGWTLSRSERNVLPSLGK